MTFDRKTICKVCVFIFAVFLCSGCETVFINPLSDPSLAKPDDRLFGQWVCIDEQDKGVTLKFDKGRGAETDISVIERDYKEKNPAFTMFPTTVGKYTYMNLSPTEDRDKGYLIAKYQVTGDQMIIWIFDSEKVKAAMTQGKLNGTPGNGIGTTTVSDDAQHIAAFLKTPESEKTFEYFHTFKRLKK